MENVSLFCYNQLRNPNKKGCAIMKKVLLGCLGTVLVLLALLLGFLEFFFFHLVRRTTPAWL